MRLAPLNNIAYHVFCTLAINFFFWIFENTWNGDGFRIQIDGSTKNIEQSHLNIPLIQVLILSQLRWRYIQRVLWLIEVSFHSHGQCTCLKLTKVLCPLIKLRLNGIVFLFVISFGFLYNCDLGSLLCWTGILNAKSDFILNDNYNIACMRVNVFGTGLLVWDIVVIVCNLGVCLFKK